MHQRGQKLKAEGGRSRAAIIVCERTIKKKKRTTTTYGKRKAFFRNIRRKGHQSE